ncbi:MAG: hypothetical protein E7Z84_02095 [Methanosphaera stadtmanae]|jgi:hypothetical protein|nr:hypothetical protein [Methanosphaera stadtmanae]
MKNSLKDLTVNVKKSIDREYDGQLNMEPNFDEDQKMLDDNIITSIKENYDNDDDFENIIVDHSENDLIEPNQGPNIDTIRLIKVKSLSSLSDELDNVNKTRVPAIIDLKYIQERRKSEFKQIGSTIKAFKKATKSSVILLGSVGTVIVVAPSDIRILK